MQGLVSRFMGDILVAAWLKYHRSSSLSYGDILSKGLFGSLFLPSIRYAERTAFNVFMPSRASPLV